MASVHITTKMISYAITKMCSAYIVLFPKLRTYNFNSMRKLNERQYIIMVIHKQHELFHMPVNAAIYLMFMTLHYLVSCC